MDLHQKIKTQFGSIYLVISEHGLKYLGFSKPLDFGSNPKEVSSRFQNQLLLKIERELDEYFNGKRKEFTVKLDLNGTDFQKLVWSKLQNIPYSKTFSYKEIAVQVGKPTGSRAVGNANGKNPVCIIIPCHRVIAADGSLGGYSGGLENKVKLLKIESICLK